MYIRFVIPEKDRDSGCRLGIFQAIYELRVLGDLYPYEDSHTQEVLTWFNQNLRRPNSLARARRHNPTAKAICWFKDNAHDHISRMWEIVAILEEHDFIVNFIRTGRPGYITHEDRFQVAAEPFSDTEA